MKKKINVIDLDKTLIKYDSFGLIVKDEILKLNFIVFFYSLLRIFRIVSLENFKKKITLLIGNKYEDEFFKKFALTLYNNIDSKVLTEIEKETDDNTINILLSASPDLYVQYIIEKMNWIGKGSYFDSSGNFIHLHSQGKITWVLEHFKKSLYNYNMAISDSSSDDELLQLFKRKIKWTLH